MLSVCGLLAGLRWDCQRSGMEAGGGGLSRWSEDAARGRGRGRGRGVRGGEGGGGGLTSPREARVNLGRGSGETAQKSSRSQFPT